MPGKHASLSERLWRRVDKTGDCWPWKGAVARGYGVIGSGPGQTKKLLYTHRVAWLDTYGALPPQGWDLDHLCRNPICCNPSHLQPVPHRVNVLRGNAPNAVVQRTGMCVKGLHPFEGDNIVQYKNGDRTCRACRDARMAARRAKERAEKVA